MLKKKLVSVLLAMVMVLGLSVPAFAAEEEPEPAAEPAVQTEVETVAEDEVAAPTEVETEPAGEPVVQEDIHAHDYTISDASYVDGTDYTASGHAYYERDRYSCKYCDDHRYVSYPKTYQRHHFQVTEYGTAIGSNGETVTVYLYQCWSCDYSYTEER